MLEGHTDWKSWAADRPTDWMNRRITAETMRREGCTTTQIADAMDTTRRSIQRLLNGAPPQSITHKRVSIDIPDALADRLRASGTTFAEALQRGLDGTDHAGEIIAIGSESIRDTHRRITKCGGRLRIDQRHTRPAHPSNWPRRRWTDHVPIETLDAMHMRTRNGLLASRTSHGPALS